MGNFPDRAAFPRVSAGNGCLRAAMGPSEYGMKVGISLKTDLSESTKLIECFIK